MEALEKNEFDSTLISGGDRNLMLGLLLRQMEKDFQMSGFDLRLEIEEYGEYEKLHQLLVDILTACIPHRVDKITRLCYRIDLGENKVSKMFSKYDSDKALLYLADAMIMRELKKVIFKYQVENQKN